MIKTQEIQIKAQNLLDSLTENKFILNLDKKIADGITKLKIADTEIHKGADFTVTETIEGLDCDYLINITNSAKLTELQTILKHIIDGTQFSSVEGTISGAGTVNTDFVNMAHNIDIIIYYNTRVKGLALSENSRSPVGYKIEHDNRSIASADGKVGNAKLSIKTFVNDAISYMKSANEKLTSTVYNQEQQNNFLLKKNIEAHEEIKRLNQQIQILLKQQSELQQAANNQNTLNNQLATAQSKIISLTAANNNLQTTNNVQASKISSLQVQNNNLQQQVNNNYSLSNQLTAAQAQVRSLQQNTLAKNSFIIVNPQTPQAAHTRIKGEVLQANINLYRSSGSVICNFLQCHKLHRVGLVWNPYIANVVLNFKLKQSIKFAIQAYREGCLSIVINNKSYYINYNLKEAKFTISNSSQTDVIVTGVTCKGSDTQQLKQYFDFIYAVVKNPGMQKQNYNIC